MFRLESPHAIQLAISAFVLFLVFGQAVAQEEVDPNRGRVGDYTVTRDGVTGVVMEQLLNRMNWQSVAASMKNSVNADGKTLSEKSGEESTWDVFVPDDYNKDLPYGVLVYISASDVTKIAKDWKPILSEHRIIMIGANKSGNDHGTPWRMSRAVDAVQIVSELYDVDRDRIYVSGISGGGRVASQVSMAFSDVFTGGFYFVGCNFYKTVKSSGGDAGAVYSGFWPRADRQLIGQAKKNSRFVFFTGSKDFNRDNTSDVYNGYLKDGFSSCLYLEKPAHGHRNPPADWFKKGMAFLDAPFAEEAADAFKKAQASQERDKLGAALAGFRIASARAAGQEFQAEANQGFLELQTRYSEGLAEIEAQIEAEDRSAASASLKVFQKEWSPVAKAESKRLSKEIRKLPKK